MNEEVTMGAAGNSTDMAGFDPKLRLTAFAGGWEAHRHRHCIWIVSPEGYQHHHAFDEVAEALEEAFSELGGSAPITRHPSQWNGRSPIVLGTNLLPAIGSPALPDGTILYNLEQVDLGSSWFKTEYLALLSRYPVLDYSPRNRDELRRIGISHAGLLEIGYSPVLTRIPTDREKDIDVLFYGSVNERRARVLDDLRSRGLNVVSLFGVYGAQRDEAIARAKIVLNHHHYRPNIFEMVRISYLLANKVCVVAEGDSEDPDVKPLAGGIELAAYDDLVDRCVELVGDAARRQKLAETGFERICGRRQSDLLRRCVLDQRSSAKAGEVAFEKKIISGEAYSGGRIPADGMHFVGCSFAGTTFIYFGGEVPIFDKCQLSDVTFDFLGPARNTAEFLRMLIQHKVITGL